ncbi:hypothetical protein CRG98_037927 [Punica granatum]|uniref:Uncharacterized protein n=1 Tax=Punica granatum TaxID=22663 RepID=A0A2I0ICH3_PUNGR|nr:hypothetical protein CRG98_037927 [Punica granatum]
MRSRCVSHCGLPGLALMSLRTHREPHRGTSKLARSGALCEAHRPKCGSGEGGLVMRLAMDVALAHRRSCEQWQWRGHLAGVARDFILGRRTKIRLKAKGYLVLFNVFSYYSSVEIAKLSYKCGNGKATSSQCELIVNCVS